MRDNDEFTCTCRKCHELKPMDEFYRTLFNKNRTTGVCKVCWNAYTTDRRKAKKSGIFDPEPPSGIMAELITLVLAQNTVLHALARACEVSTKDLPSPGKTLAAAIKAMPPAQAAAFSRASDAAAEVAETVDDSTASFKAQVLRREAQVHSEQSEAEFLSQPKGAKPTSRASTPWPKKDGEVSAEEMALHLAYLKELMAYSEANPHESIPTGRGTVMKGGREYGMDGKEAYMTLDPVYKALSRERSTDSLENW